jgi:hypothetical protein
MSSWFSLNKALILHQLVNEGISVDEAWRLFQQIVEGLVHMSSLGIVSAF